MTDRRTNVVRLDGRPLDYPERFQFVPSHSPPSFGERMVDWFRQRAFAIGIACYLIGVVTACYFAFELGRGL